MLARKGAGCAWLRSRRVKNAALLTAAARASARLWQVGTKEQAPRSNQGTGAFYSCQFLYD
jgi:hypothetical protein